MSAEGVDGAALSKGAEPVKSVGLGWAAILGLGLSAALVLYLFTHLDLRAVLGAVGRAHPLWLGGATLAYVALFPVRGLRWAVLLKPLAPVSAGLATRGFLIGFMANNLLPARLGDLVRAFVLARKAQVPSPASFATVMLERVFDGVTVVGILSLSLAVLELDNPTRAAQLHGIALLMGLAFGMVLVGCVGLAIWERPTLALVRWGLTPCPEGLRTKLLGLFERLAAGLHALRSAKEAAQVALLSLTVWGLEVVVYVGVAHALDLEVGPMGLALVMAILTLGLTAPSAPGFVGVFEALVIPALTLLGVAEEPAAAFALLLHAIHYLPGTVLGLVAAWTTGVDLRDLSPTRLVQRARAS